MKDRVVMCESCAEVNPCCETCGMCLGCAAEADQQGEGACPTCGGSLGDLSLRVWRSSDGHVLIDLWGDDQTEIATANTSPEALLGALERTTEQRDRYLQDAIENDQLCAATTARAEAAEARVAELEAENAKLRRFAEDAANYRESAHDYDRDVDHPERAFDDEEEWDRLEMMARAALAAKEE